jgi:hypothetical protein
MGSGMKPISKTVVRRAVATLALLALPIGLGIVAGGASAAPLSTTGRTSAGASSTVTTSSLGKYSPTFVGPAATGCDSAGCSLLTGPTATPSTANLTTSANPPGTGDNPQPDPDVPVALRSPALPKDGPDPTPPTVSCQPLGPGCDPISVSSGGATGVKGLNAVSSGTLSTNVTGLDIEPADQGLCGGNGYIVEDNNIGEIQIFNTSLHKVSPVIPLDTVMGLTALNWSSGGDISCLYDPSNGGHWIFTEIVSASSEANEGAFNGCFAGVADSCYEGVAVTKGSNPFGPYNVYFVNANYNPNEPGYPYLFNDFAKISTTRDAFLLFYDEFPDNSSVPGIGGGFFNGAQQFAFNKRALELGEPTTLANGKPNPAFTVAIENMGTIPTPDGTCSSDNTFHEPGFTCWYAAIPAQAPDPSQYDNSHGGSGFILDTLDYYGSGDDRLAVFDWTGLDNLNSPNCASCSGRGGIHFGGQLFSGVDFYYGEGFLAAQKAGPIPLGDECGAAGLSAGTSPPASCPEGGIATNGDFMTQVSQAQGQLWGATTTEIDQTYRSEPSPEVHQGAVYWVIGTKSFDRAGVFTLTSEGYVSPEHEDLSMPAMAAEGLPSQDGGNGGAIMTFTLTGNGGPTGADNGGFYPSTAFATLTATSGGLTGPVHVADLGRAPQDGFTEYQGYPGPTRARWGDYSWALFVPGTGGRIYFATNYIQYPNCTGSAFTLTLGTCGGTRDGFANWGTSVNYVVP